MILFLFFFGSGGFQKGLGLKAWTNWLGVHESQNKILKEMCVSEMNSSLIAFANEIRKPNGDCYRPDILVYFVYGNIFLQSYLFSFIYF